MRRKVFIVEGAHDASKLKEVLGDVHVITTNGSEISDDTLSVIRSLDKTHDLIVFTDPDYTGQRIRRLVSEGLIHVYHAFLKQNLAISKNKKKIGIEHASKEDILYALKHLQLADNNNVSDITTHFLFEQKLIGHLNSKKLRKKLSQALNLGHVNGKTLKTRLALFNITKEDIERVMHESST